MITKTKVLESIDRYLEKQPLCLPTNIARQYDILSDRQDVYGPIYRGESNKYEVPFGISMAGYALAFDDVNVENFTNNFTHNNKEIGVKKLTTKLKGSKVSSRRIRMASAKFLGQANIIQIPLPHSGIWLTIDPIPKVDRSILDMSLADRESDLGMKTAMLIHTNDNVLYTKTIVDFVRKFIVESTLSINKNDDIFDYISILDMPIIMLAILHNFHPNGFNIAITCKNFLEIEDDEVKCEHVIEGEIDALKMLHIATDKLSDEQKDILEKRTPNSVSLTEYESYKEDSCYDTQLKFTRGDAKLELTLGFVSINSFIVTGEKFINEISKLIDDVITGDEEEQVRELKIRNVIADVIIAKYLHFIKKAVIEIPNQPPTKITGESGIFEMLKDFGDDSELIDEIFTKVLEYINDIQLAIIGTPIYTCPNCRKDSAPDGQEPFTNVTVFDIFQAFTQLRTQR